MSTFALLTLPLRQNTLPVENVEQMMQDFASHRIYCLNDMINSMKNDDKEKI